MAAPLHHLKGLSDETCVPVHQTFEIFYEFYVFENMGIKIDFKIILMIFIYAFFCFIDTHSMLSGKNCNNEKQLNIFFIRFAPNP